MATAKFFYFAYRCSGTAAVLHSNNVTQRRETWGWYDGRGLESVRAEEYWHGAKRDGARVSHWRPRSEELACGQLKKRRPVAGQNWF